MRKRVIHKDTVVACSRLTKQIIASMCAFAVLASITGCHRSGAKKQKEYRVVKETDPYFSAQEVELQIPLKEDKELQQLLVHEPKITGDQVRFKFDLSYKVPKELDDKQYLCAQGIDNFTDEERLLIWEEWMTYFDEGVAIFDLDGNFLGVEKEADQDVELPTDAQDMGLFYSESLKDGRLLCWSYEKVGLFNQEGKELASYSPELFGGKVYLVGDQIFIGGRNYDDENPENTYDYLQELDQKTLKEKGDRIRLSGSNGADSICAGSQGIYAMNSDGIHRINTEIGKEEDFLLWSDTDLNYVGIVGEGAMIGENTCRLIKYTDETIDEQGHFVMHVSLVTLTKEAKNPHAGKTVIVLGDARENDNDLVEAVVAYNLLPEKKVRIQFRDYSAYVNASGAYEKAISTIADKVYLDMLAGTGPDILVNFGSSPSFQSDGILMDLMTFLTGATGLSDSSYYGALLRTYEKNGKIFHIPTSVELYGFWGNRKYLSDTTAVSDSDLDVISATLPENMQILPETEYEDLLEDLLSQRLGRYIDPQSGRCDFSEASFAALLETVKKFGSHVEEPDVEVYEEAMAKEPATLLREEMVAMIPFIISSPGDYKKCLSLQNGKGGVYAYGDRDVAGADMAKPDKAAAGSDGSDTQNSVAGMSVDSRMTVAISANTPYAQESWDFIRTLFSKENQMNFAESLGGIPVSRSAVDILCEESGMTEQEKSAFAEELERTHEVRVLDDAVMGIVKEEAEAYFLGQKDINTVVSTIQNRVATVLKERG
ncbi:MAG: carbohydrate ABC transporter substrate-binding protein [Clostridiales bacterium]|nr:carbohydrate ABC transporter substrate-binding protein [Clostridiales bacterium]